MFVSTCVIKWKAPIVSLKFYVLYMPSNTFLKLDLKCEHVVKTLSPIPIVKPHGLAIRSVINFIRQLQFKVKSHRQSYNLYLDVIYLYDVVQYCISSLVENVELLKLIVITRLKKPRHIT